MKRSSAAAWSILAVLSTAPSGRAEIIVPCIEQAPLSYYVLSNQTLIPNTLYSYTALPDRYVDEILPREGQAIVHAVCEYDVLDFEAKHDIATNAYLGGELFAVVSTNNQQVVGTRWRDQKHPFDQGGGIAFMRYRECLDLNGDGLPLVNDVGFWSAGMDTSAMNNTSPALVAQEWTGRVQALVEQISEDYMFSGPALLKCYATVDFQTFLGKYAGKDVPRFYLQVDPTNGVPGTP